MIPSGSALRRSGPVLSSLTSAICAGTAMVALTLAPSCSSRSGGGAPASPAPAAVQAAPEILRFGEDKTSILAGQTLDLKADFANGTAVIEPGDLVVTSGESIALTPTETTTYTLTVTDSAGATTTETASVTVAPLVSGMALLAGEFNGLGDVDGVGALARFCRPNGVAVDGAGNAFVTDTSNSTIRKIAPDGTVSTFAGTAGQYGAVDAQGAAARFRLPMAITIDAQGNLYVIDSGSVIRKITPDGTVTTLNTHGPDSLTPFPFGYLSSLVADGAGTLFVTDAVLCTINRITSDGTVTILAGQSGVSGTQDGNGTSASFQSPLGIALDAEDILYVADAGIGAIRTITPSGEVNTVFVPDDAAFPNAIAVDGSGTIYVTNFDTIAMIPSAGSASTLAGSASINGTVDGVGTSAGFRNLVGLTLDSKGNLYAVDSSDAVIRKITKDADVSTLAGKAQSSINTSNDGVGESAHFSVPSGMATDAQGNTYVADLYANAIRKVASTGVVTTLAGQLGVAGYQNGEGGQALFNAPNAVAVDSAGNVYVADDGNSVIRKITPQGVVSLLAGNPSEMGNKDGDSAVATFESIPAIALDGAGNVYVAQPYAVRKIDATSGAVTTLAGVADADPGYADGAATDARFNGLEGIAVDGKTGTVYVSDRNNDRIRRIMPDGETTTLAGSGAFGHQDGPHDNATFGALNSLTLDGAGAYLYVADAGSDLIRRISTSDGSVTTVVGTPGMWGTVPGPLPANLNAPRGVAWDPTGPGHLLISVPDAILRVTF